MTGLIVTGFIMTLLSLPSGRRHQAGASRREFNAALLDLRDWDGASERV